MSVLVGLRREFRLLRLALGSLLVAEGLRVRLLGGLLLEARDHVLDQALALFLDLSRLPFCFLHILIENSTKFWQNLQKKCRK